MKIQLNASSIAIGLAVGALTAGGITFAATSPSVTKINACQSKSTGALRILTTGVCKTTEVPISWNSSGPQGVQGPQGLKGDKGDTGATGAQGKPGQDAGRCSEISGSENRGMQWWSCNFDGRSFRYANLFLASLAGASAVGSDFTRANLRSADLSGIDATGARFRNATFDRTCGGDSQTNMTEAVLDNADFFGTTICVKFDGTSLRGANLRNATVLGSTVDYQDGQTMVDFRGADLRGVKFGLSQNGQVVFNTTLVGVDFRGAQTLGISLRNAYFYRTDFSTSDIAKDAFNKMNGGGSLNFSGRDLSGIDWAPSDLYVATNYNNEVGWDSQTSAYYSDFTGVNFTGARLTAANLAGSTVEGADFTGATFTESICDSTPRATSYPYSWNGGTLCKSPSQNELKSYLCNLQGTPKALPVGWRFEGGCIRNW